MKRNEEDMVSALVAQIKCCEGGCFTEGRMTDITSLLEKGADPAACSTEVRRMSPLRNDPHQRLDPRDELRTLGPHRSPIL